MQRRRWSNAPERAPAPSLRYRPKAGSAAGAVLALMVCMTPATGRDLVYTPVNPSFGGNPFYSDHLRALAELQNEHDGRSDRSSLSRTPADQFVSQLQSRLLSSLAGEVNEAIFGENAADSGRIEFGDQVITFERGLEAVRLTIENTADGSTTNVSIPLLQVEGP